MIDPAVLSKTEKLKAAGAEVDEIILFLKNNSVNKIDSIKAVHNLYAKSLSEAKVLVDYSYAWSDRFHADVVLKSKAIEELLDSINQDDQSSGH
jgi:ribosomal protein L7/L12